MFLLVQVPTVVEHQSTQSSQCMTGLFASMHAPVLLSPGDDLVVTLFDVGAIERLDAGIGALVYELYGLAEEEIAVAEGRSAVEVEAGVLRGMN